MSDKKKQVENFSYSTSLRNPRIVRAPRDSGGKDRHSKVCTLRGLRDRRIRLSVSTAVQLYDLQDRLGLPQPSKVVDWLLEAAKDDVDRLPPLPAFPGLPLPHHERPPAAATLGAGLQNFFPVGGGSCFPLPYDSVNRGSNNNNDDNNNYYNSSCYFGDPAGSSLVGHGEFPTFASGPGSHPLYLYQPANANFPASIFPPFASYETGSTENNQSRQINFLQN